MTANQTILQDRKLETESGKYSQLADVVGRLVDKAEVLSLDLIGSDESGMGSGILQKESSGIVIHIQS